jgi:hypothetical protein
MPIAPKTASKIVAGDEEHVGSRHGYPSADGQFSVSCPIFADFGCSYK